MRVSKAERKKNARYFYSRLTSGFKDRAAIVIKCDDSTTNPNIKRTQFITNLRDRWSRPVVIAQSNIDGIVGCFNELIEFIGDGIEQEKYFHQDGFNEWLNNYFDIRIVYNDGLVIMLEYFHG